MISNIVGLLVMLNPFAMFIYLEPVMEKLDDKTFRTVLYKASTISFFIFLVFLVAGDWVFQKLLLIHFESFRIFGGIVIFSFAYLFIVQGKKSLITMKENLDNLANEIALPFMVGAGTISLTIVMANELLFFEGFFILILVMFLNIAFILLLKTIKDGLKKEKLKVAFNKNMQILLRLNGFFVGAIGINMIVIGISNLLL